MAAQAFARAPDSAAVPAAEPGGALLVGRPSEVVYATADGRRVHALTYRPDAEASQGALLLRSSVDGDSCWSDLPLDLRASGWRVQLVDPREQPAAAESPMDASREEPAAPEPLFGDSIRFVALLCTGAEGWDVLEVADWVARLDAVIWLLPAGPERELSDWPRRLGSAARLLLVASQPDPESLALAGDVYSVFNNQVELRLFDWGRDAQELLAWPFARRELVSWLESRAGRKRAHLPITTGTR